MQCFFVVRWMATMIRSRVADGKRIYNMNEKVPVSVNGPEDGDDDEIGSLF